MGAHNHLPLRANRTPNREYSDSRGQFLNVDLDIAAPFDLAALGAALERRMVVLHAQFSSRRSSILAEARDVRPRSAEAAVRELARGLASLRGEPLRQWRSCSCKSFNIGYSAPRCAPGLEDVLSQEALAAVLAVGGTLAVTVYACQQDGRKQRARASRK